MSEPKKETVRIVLPPRRDGQPPASSSRETAMINLPPKPILKPGAPESVSAPRSCGRAARISAATQAVFRSERPSSSRVIRSAPRSQATLDCGSGTPRSQTAFLSARCSEAAFRGWGSSWLAKIGFVRWAAAARSEAAGHGNAVGVDRSVGGQGAIRSGRACRCTGFALSGEQEGDGEGSAQHIGSKAGVASGVGAFAKEAGCVIHGFEFGHYRCASSSN